MEVSTLRQRIRDRSARTEAILARLIKLDAPTTSLLDCGSKQLLTPRPYGTHKQPSVPRSRCSGHSICS
jgi:hypothetical protein